MVLKLGMMMKRDKAVAICRVSTPEQMENNSLTRQEINIRRAVDLLGVELAREPWSGSMSSKAGTNTKRKDLQEIIAYCKANRNVKYLIVDEPDRFMRSIDEAFYFEVLFRDMGVKVWYASDPALNTDDINAKLLKFSKYFPAEGGNNERISKSVNGHRQAINEGRYTFPPKPGYKKGNIPGVHIPNDTTFPYLKESFRMIASGKYKVQDCLKWLNQSNFTKYHAPWKMDKFSKFAVDPYNAGILKVGKQVDSENPKGEHIPMLTLEEHEKIKEILSGRAKPRNKKIYYNPEFPLNKILLCSDCDNKFKFTGSIKNNGYNRRKTTYYYKYHCRGCGKSYHRKDIHEHITKRFEKIRFEDEHKNPLEAALREVWRQRQKDTYQSIKQLE